VDAEGEVEVVVFIFGDAEGEGEGSAGGDECRLDALGVVAAVGLGLDGRGEGCFG
jgi:hypothetical protein